MQYRVHVSDIHSSCDQHCKSGEEPEATAHLGKRQEIKVEGDVGQVLGLSQVGDGQGDQVYHEREHDHWRMDLTEQSRETSAQ